MIGLNQNTRNIPGLGLAARLLFFLLIWLILVLVLSPPLAQARTVGLFINESGAYDGYTLFAPMGARTTYLIDNQGRQVHSWESSRNTGTSVYLLESGLLLRTCRYAGPTNFDAGGIGGTIELLDWDSNVVREFDYAADTHLAHHDVKYLDNGNILLIAWEKIDQATALAAGRNPALLSEGELWPDKIIEMDPLGRIVWQWRVWDHLVQDFDPAAPNYGDPAAHPELIDLNHTNRRAEADWNHINSIDYHVGLDQIILSVHGFNEVWIIDHSTTTAQAAGHIGGRSGKGGDLLFRWGNPAAYGAAGAQQLFGQHDAQWIPAGSPGAGDILIYNNGQFRPLGDYSSVDQITPPQNGSGGYDLTGAAFGPAGPVWTYLGDPPSEFYSRNISGAQRLPNGNTLICEGASGTLFEVTASGQVVWLYVNPVAGGTAIGENDPIPEGPQGQQNQVFKVRRYGPDYPGLAGRDLTPGGVIER